MNAAATDLPSSYLVLPPTGDRTVAELQREVRKIALKQLMTFPTARLSAPVRRPLGVVRRVLTDLLRTQPAVVLDAIGHVDVQTPLLVCDIGPQLTGKEPDDLFRAAIPPLLAQLAHRAKSGAVPEAILWDLPMEHLADAVGRRVFRFETPIRGFVADPLGLEVAFAADRQVRVPAAPAAFDADGVRTERPFHRLHPELPRLDFAMYDSNPLSMYEAHPDKFGNAISLGNQPLDVWLKAFHEALELIRIALPTWFEEIKTSARRFIPVGYLPERHLSATYREAPGVAYLTLCDNPLTIAEAMVHETQHTKANLLSWIDPIVHNGHTCWTQSPVRPDLRPLWGVLLAVHAFVPVSALHHRLAEMDHPVTRGDRFLRRRVEVIAGNHRGMKAVLENAEPTASGKRMIDEMHALHEFLRVRGPGVPPGMDIDPEILPPG